MRTWHCWWVCGGQVLGGHRERVLSHCVSGAVICRVQGGAVGIRVLWDCNLDAGGSDCRPHYSFQLQEQSYNFRYHFHSPQCPPATPQPSPPLPVLLWRPGRTPPQPSSLDTLLCVRGAGRSVLSSKSPSTVSVQPPPEPILLHPICPHTQHYSCDP